MIFLCVSSLAVENRVLIIVKLSSRRSSHQGHHLGPHVKQIHFDRGLDVPSLPERRNPNNKRTPSPRTYLIQLTRINKAFSIPF